jgi:hypothetical protein
VRPVEHAGIGFVMQRRSEAAMRLDRVIPLLATILAAASLVTGCAVSAELGQPRSQRSPVGTSAEAPPTYERTRVIERQVIEEPRPAAEEVQPQVEQNYY